MLPFGSGKFCPLDHPAPSVLPLPPRSIEGSPRLATAYRPSSGRAKAIKPLPQPDQFIRDFVLREPTQVKDRAKILDSGPGWVIQEEVNPGAGLEFLSRNSMGFRTNRNFIATTDFDFLNHNISSVFLKEPDLSKFRQLAVLMKVWKKNGRLRTEDARQIAWDQTKDQAKAAGS